MHEKQQRNHAALRGAFLKKIHFVMCQETAPHFPVRASRLHGKKRQSRFLNSSILRPVEFDLEANNVKRKTDGKI